MHGLREALQRIISPNSRSPVQDILSVHNSNSIRDKSPVRDFRSEGNTASFLWQGDIKKLLDGLSQVPYTNISVTEPDLNEIFMHFYEQEGSL